jgi:hypothetical protein
MECNNHPLFRPDDAVLTLSPIKTEYTGDAAGPQLITVPAAAAVFLLRCIVIHGLSRQRVMHEFRIEYLLAIPTTAIGVQHSKAQILLCPGKSARLSIDFVGEFQPDELVRVDSDLMEQPIREIFFMFWPVRLRRIAPSIQDPEELYVK